MRLPFFNSRSESKSASTPDELAVMMRQAISLAANGVHVTPEKALKIPEVLACVNVLSQSMSMLPFSVYERDGETRKADKENRVYKLLSQSPNELQSPFEFRRMMMWHAASHGNAFAHITRVGKRPLKLVPIHPKRVTVHLREDWTVEYEVTGNNQHSKRNYSSDEIFHLRGPIATDVHQSESPVVWCRDAIATLLVVQQFTGKFFRGNAKAKGAVSLPDGQFLKQEQFDRFKQEVNQHIGSDSVPLFEGGMKWLAMDYSARDSLLNEITHQQILAICRIWRIQPHLIQSLADATFSNIEQQAREFVDHTLMPWIRLWESAIQTQLMDPTDADLYPKFSVQALLRGDSKTRSEVYRAAVGGPYMTPNEARGLEDMDQIEGGDELLQPLNMGNASEAGETGTAK